MCWAPANTWGATCPSTKGLFGQTNTYIDYYFEVQGASIPVFCQAYGMAPYVQGAACQLGWHNLGVVSPKSVFRLVWGHVGATPAISCYGQQYAVYVRWSWSFGYGQFGCNAETSKVQVENQTLIGVPNETILVQEEPQDLLHEYEIIDLNLTTN